MPSLVAYAAPLILGYVCGAIPFAYVVVRLVAHEDITLHGTGNVGSMNVRRTTGSWAWFAVAMFLDIMKGVVPVLLARYWVAPALGLDDRIAEQVTVVAVVVGHNWPLSMLLITGKLRGGKGLAPGAGALFVYNPFYALIPLAVSLLLIAITRTLLVGQIAAPVVLLAYVALTEPSDLLFVLVAGGIVGYKHARRVPGLIRGTEPRWNVTDDKGKQNPGLTCALWYRRAKLW